MMFMCFIEERGEEAVQEVAVRTRRRFTLRKDATGFSAAKPGIEERSSLPAIACTGKVLFVVFFEAPTHTEFESRE